MRYPTETQHRTCPLPGSHVDALTAIVDAKGESYVARSVGTTRGTLARAMARRPLYQGTRIMLIAWLREHAPAVTSRHPQETQPAA